MLSYLSASLPTASDRSCFSSHLQPARAIRAQCPIQPPQPGLKILGDSRTNTDSIPRTPAWPAPCFKPCDTSWYCQQECRGVLVVPRYWQPRNGSTISWHAHGQELCITRIIQALGFLWQYRKTLQTGKAGYRKPNQLAHCHKLSQNLTGLGSADMQLHEHMQAQTSPFTVKWIWLWQEFTQSS